MQNYKSLRAAVMCATLVNTHTHTHPHTRADSFRSAFGPGWYWDGRSYPGSVPRQVWFMSGRQIKLCDPIVIQGPYLSALER